jgi:hypothetical protein
MPHITQKKKVIITTAILIVGSFFLFSGRSAQAYLNDYSKTWDGTLSAGEWNNLASDFLNKSGAATMTGPLGINTSAPASGLQVNGPIVGSSYGGSMSAGNISSGYFGSNTSGGNYSFPGFVGIGTSSPAFALDVVGDINMTGTLRYNGNPFSSSQWLTNSTAIYYNNGNVGIGTSAPTSRLTLTGGDFQIDHNRSIMVNYGANSTMLIGNYADSQGFGYGTTTTYTASIAVEGDVKGNRFCIKEDCKAAWTDIVAAGGGGQWTVNGSDMYNANSGNVGIGTTNPGKKFEIVDGTDSIKFGKWSTGGYASIWFDQASPSNTNYGFLGNSTETEFNAAATIYFNIGDVEKMRIGSTGNIGIGTMDPQSRLDVVGGVYAQGESHLYQGTYFDPVSGTLAAVKLSQNASASFPSAPFSAGINGAAGANLNTYAGYFNNASTVSGTGLNYGVYAIGNNNYFSGNVGIGNTAPATKLDVSGSFRNTLATTHSLLGGAGNVLVMADNTGTLYSTTTSAVINPIVTSASGWTANGTTVYKSDTNGNVGIGTTNPTLAKFTLLGDMYLGSMGDGLRLSADINSSYIDGIENPLVFRTIRTTGSDSILFQTSSTTRMLINGSSGNVGIGTTAPNQLLEVAGATSTIKISDMTVARQPQLELVRGTIDTFGGDGYTDWRMYVAGGDLRFLRQDNGGNSGDAVTFGALGNVGIGITNPSTKLYVAGTSLNTLATTHSLLGGAGNAFVMTDNTGALYSSNDFSSTGLSLSGTNLIRNADLAFSDNFWAAIGSGGTLVYNRVWSDDATAPVRSHKKVTASITALGTGDVWAIGFNVENLKLNTDYNASCYFKTTGTTDGYFHMERFYSDWTGRSDQNSSNFTYANDGAWHRESFVFNTGVYPNVDFRVRGFDIIGSWDITGCQLTEGKQLNSFSLNPLDEIHEGSGRYLTNSSVYGSVSKIISNNYSATNAYSMYVAAPEGAITNKYAFVTEAGAGNIGLGLSNPGTRLEVSGTFKNSLATTHSLLGGGGNVVVMADNTGTLYSTSTASFISSNALDLWKGTKNGNIWNGDAGVGNVGIGTTNAVDGKLTVAQNMSSYDSAFAASHIKLLANNTIDNLGFVGITYAASTAANYGWSVGANRTAGGESNFVWRYHSSNASGTERMRISDTGNVGIGVTNPVAKLDIITNYNSQGFKMVNDRDDGGINFQFYDPDNINGGVVFKGDSNNSMTVGIGTSTPAAALDIYATTNSQGLNVSTQRDSNGILLNVFDRDAPNDGLVVTDHNGTTNVGIGTTTPSARLTVEDSSTDGTPMFNLFDTNDNMSVFQVEGSNGSVPGVIIKQTGNVGIAITNPTVRLDVAGTFRNTLATTHSLLGGGGNVLVMADNAGTLYSTTTASFISNNIYSSTIVVNPTSGVGWYRIATTGGASGGTVYVAANMDNKQQKLEFNYNIRTYLDTNEDVGSINVLRTFDYNQGPISQIRIGADSTTGNYNAYLDIYVNSATTPAAFTVYGNNGASFLASPTYNPSTPTYSQTVNLNNISFKGMVTSQNLQVLGRTFLSGNVGIGTTYPESRLDVRGFGTTTEIALRVSDVNNNPKITVLDNGNIGVGSETPSATLDMISTYAAQGFKLAADRDTAGGILFQVYDRDTPTQGLVFTQENRLGVGTTTPGTVFSVSGSDDNTTLFNVVNTVARLDNTNVTNNNWSGVVFRANDTTGGNWFSGAIASQITSHASNAISGDLAIFTTAGNNFSEKLRILGTGNVGIGLTNPTTKLYVAGTSLNTLATTHSLLGGAGNVVVMADNTGTLYSTTTASFISNNGLALWKGTLNGSIFNGDAGAGNVGIGTTTPTYKLDVNGTFRATASSSSIILDTNGDISIGI